MRNTLSWYELTNQMEITGIVAKDVPKAETLDGIPLHPSSRICELEYDYILILSDNWFRESASVSGSQIDLIKLPNENGGSRLGRND